MSDTPLEPPAPPRRPARFRMPLILGGVALVVLIVIGVVLMTILGGSREPTQTVNDLIRSIETGDCSLYVAVTTDYFRAGTITAGDCDTSGAFTGSGTFDYTLDISGSEVLENTATVEATMSIVDTSSPDSEPIVTPITFELVQETGAWKVDSSY